MVSGHGALQIAADRDDCQTGQSQEQNALFSGRLVNTKVITS
jgi:hypothetical protein